MGSTLILLMLLSEGVNFVVCLICGILIWRMRRGVPDCSRIYFSLLLFGAVLIFGFQFLFTLAGGSAVEYYRQEVLEPKLTFFGIFFATMLLLYSLELMRPNWLDRRRLPLFALPLLLMVVPRIVGGATFYRSLETVDEAVESLGELNVGIRVSELVLMVCYLLALFVMPFNNRQSSADRHWVRTYVLFITLSTLLFIGKVLTPWPAFDFAHQICLLTFVIYYTYFELVDRIPVPRLLPAGVVGSGDRERSELWARIVEYLDGQEQWRNPDMSLDLLCEEVASNRTYVSLCFREYAQTTFTDYLNRRRINYVVEQLKANPSQGYKQLSFEVGYRTRSTFWRNFVHYVGVSPTEFSSKLLT